MGAGCFEAEQVVRGSAEDEAEGGLGQVADVWRGHRRHGQSGAARALRRAGIEMEMASELNAMRVSLSSAC